MNDPSKYTETTKENCKEAILSSEVKNQGITCAYYELEFTIQKEDPTVIKKNTCYLFDPDSINSGNIAKKDLKEFALNLIRDELEGGDDDEDDNVKIKITIFDNSGHKIYYDSETKTLAVNNDGNNSNNDNSGNNDNNGNNGNNNNSNNNTKNNSKVLSSSKLLLFIYLLISL